MPVIKLQVAPDGPAGVRQKVGVAAATIRASAARATFPFFRFPKTPPWTPLVLLLLQLEPCEAASGKSSSTSLRAVTPGPPFDDGP